MSGLRQDLLARGRDLVQVSLLYSGGTFSHKQGGTAGSSSLSRELPGLIPDLHIIRLENHLESRF